MEATATRRRPRRTAEEWRRIVERQAASGQSVEAFCAAAGISSTSFWRWHERLSEANGAGTDGLFVELGTAPETWDVELELGAGVVLRVRRPRC